MNRIHTKMESSLLATQGLPILTCTATNGQPGDNIEHKVAAIEEDRFHGWPANNGIWQWGDEILVGYSQCDCAMEDGHNISGIQESLLVQWKDKKLVAIYCWASPEHRKLYTAASLWEAPNHL